MQKQNVMGGQGEWGSGWRNICNVTSFELYIDARRGESGNSSSNVNEKAKYLTQFDLSHSKYMSLLIYFMEARRKNYFSLFADIKILASGQAQKKYLNQFLLRRNILLAREVTLFRSAFCLRAPSKPSKETKPVQVNGERMVVDLSSCFLNISLHKKKVEEKFTWIASTLPLIYLHLLSSSEQLQAAN